MDLIDMHCDTLYECYVKGYDLLKNPGQVDLESMKNNNGLAQVFAIFLPEGEMAKADGINIGPYDLFNKIYNLYKIQIEKNQNIITPVLKGEDIMLNKKQGKMSSILSIEDAQLLEGNITRVQELYDKGIRLITLLWNAENCIGFPNSKNQEIHDKGLKPFGIEVVKEMNRLGMVIDVSHLSQGGFYDVAKYSEKPFVASHSCARALCNNPRNLTDEQLKLLGEKRGLVGVNFNSEFLKNDGGYTRIHDIVRHVDYMLDVMGEDCVALGSDFDGIECQLEIKDYSQYCKLIEELGKRYSTEVVEKICYKNVLRILNECL